MHMLAKRNAIFVFSVYALWKIMMNSSEYIFYLTTEIFWKSRYKCPTIYSLIVGKWKLIIIYLFLYTFAIPSPVLLLPFVCLKMQRDNCIYMFHYNNVVLQ